MRFLVALAHKILDLVCAVYLPVLGRSTSQKARPTIIGAWPERWRRLYAPKLEILERDILPRFPGGMLEAAAMVPLPQLPPIE